MMIYLMIIKHVFSYTFFSFYKYRTTLTMNIYPLLTVCQALSSMLFLC